MGDVIIRVLVIVMGNVWDHLWLHQHFYSTHHCWGLREHYQGLKQYCWGVLGSLLGYLVITIDFITDTLHYFPLFHRFHLNYCHFVVDWCFIHDSPPLVLNCLVLLIPLLLHCFLTIEPHYFMLLDPIIFNYLQC